MKALIDFVPPAGLPAVVLAIDGVLETLYHGTMS
jgi:hypothetical protein